MSNNSFELIKKELLQLWRCKKIIIMMVTCVLIAGFSPILAKYMPDILKTLATTSGQDVIIQFPEVTVVDSYAQLFKNMSSIGMFVIILSVCGTIVEERNSGTAILLLTKNVTRAQFIICKFLSLAIAFLSVYLVLAGVFFVYTNYLFKDFQVESFLVSFASYFVFCLLIISFIIFSSVIGKNYTVTAVLSIVFFFTINIFSFIPTLDKYSPGNISSIILKIIAGSKDYSALFLPCVFSVILTTLLIFSSVEIFNRQERI